jgi:hypothetical protein
VEALLAMSYKSPVAAVVDVAAAVLAESVIFRANPFRLRLTQ